MPSYKNSAYPPVKATPAPLRFRENASLSVEEYDLNCVLDIPDLATDRVQLEPLIVRQKLSQP